MPNCSFTNCLKASVTSGVGNRPHGSFCDDHKSLDRAVPHSGKSTEIDRFGDALLVHPVAP